MEQMNTVFVLGLLSWGGNGEGLKRKLFVSSYCLLSLKIGSCVRVRSSRYEARGKFGEHERYVKADLDYTTLAYDCRMRFLERALLAQCKTSHTTLVTQHCLSLRLS